jgi:hypothetical protein
MIIAITPSGQLELKEPNDFKGFKIAVEKPGMTDAEIAAALKGVATLDAESKNAWVSAEALKNLNGQRQPEEWIAAFDTMLEKVKPFGWLNEADGTVRGHLERA